MNAAAGAHEAERTHGPSGRALRGERIAVVRRVVSAADVVPERVPALQLVFAEAGSGWCVAGAERLPVRTRHLLVIPAGAANAPVGAPRLRVRILRLPVTLLDARLSWMMRLPGAGPYFAGRPAASLPVLRYELEETVWAAARAGLDRLAAAPEDWPFKGMADLMMLLDLLTPTLSRLPGELDDRPAADVARSARVAAVAAALERDLAQPWTAQQMAALARVSPSQLRRLFQAATGMSPTVYLARLRVERMRRMLESTDAPIAAIAREVGWPDPGYAVRRFRQHAGASPSEYRRRMRESSN